MTPDSVADHHHEWPNPRKPGLDRIFVAEEGPEPVVVVFDVVAVSHAQELRVVVQPMLSRLAPQSLQNQGNSVLYYSCNSGLIWRVFNETCYLFLAVTCQPGRGVVLATLSWATFTTCVVILPSGQLEKPFLLLFPEHVLFHSWARLVYAEARAEFLMF